ncbi:MAG: hypothetical protein ACKVPX_09755 [Myxococcaceae bacterium]
MRRWLLSFGLASCLWATPTLASRATGLQASIYLGADYWLTQQGIFSFTASLRAPIVPRQFSVGARFGGMFLTPTTGGIPVDLHLRLDISEFYLDGLVGPWFLFTTAPVRVHAGGGFGWQRGIIMVGLEAGWLAPSALLGLRVGFRL